MGAEISLDVPRLDQWKIFPHVPTRNNMACWYTAAMMVILYRMGVSGHASLVNVDTLVRLFGNKGLLVGDINKFSDEIGLTKRSFDFVFASAGPVDVCAALKQFGPLWVAIPGHVVVITGCVRYGGHHVIEINDPWPTNPDSYQFNDFMGMVNRSSPVLFRMTPYSI